MLGCHFLQFYVRRKHEDRLNFMHLLGVCVHQEVISYFIILAPLAHPTTIYEDLRKHRFIIEQQVEKDQNNLSRLTNIHLCPIVHYFYMLATNTGWTQNRAQRHSRFR